MASSGQVPKIGIGGPVGSGKTALLECIIPRLLDQGVKLAVITNDIITKEDSERLQRHHFLEPGRIVGVETGACPHTVIREDPTMNLEAVRALEEQYPDLDLVLLESGGDNLAATYSPELADYVIYVIDVAAGDDIPRKNGPGITQSDLLVINKVDLAPLVGASLEVMDRDATAMRQGKPVVFTNCKTGDGIPQVMDHIVHDVLFD